MFDGVHEEYGDKIGDFSLMQAFLFRVSFFSRRHTLFLDDFGSS